MAAIDPLPPPFVLLRIEILIIKEKLSERAVMKENGIR